MSKKKDRYDPAPAVREIIHACETRRICELSIGDCFKIDKSGPWLCVVGFTVDKLQYTRLKSGSFTRQGAIETIGRYSKQIVEHEKIMQNEKATINTLE